MDFTACYQVLAERGQQHHDCEKLEKDHKEESSLDSPQKEDLEEETVKEEDKEESRVEKSQETPTIKKFIGLKEAILYVFEIQTKRYSIYTQFTTEFPNHCTSTDIEMKEFVESITTSFNNLSLAMQDIERYFQEMKCEEYAKVVRKIQDAEREKLLVTSAVLVEEMRQRQELNNVLIYEKTVKALRVQQDTIVKGIDTIIEEWRYEIVDILMEEESLP